MKRFTYLLVFAIFLIITKQSNASSILAGDITYTHAAGDSFDVTVRVVRDCNGLPLGTQFLKVSTACKTKTYALTLISSTDITGLNPRCNVQSRCTGSYPFGFEEHIFTARVLMGGDTCCNYTLSYNQCCRNSAITTGASGQNFYIETTLNKCLAPTNSSPTFTAIPGILVSVGQNINIDFRAIDPNYDALTYELIEPFSDSGTSIGYSGSWGPQKPLSFLGFPNLGLNEPAGFHVDANSGMIKCRPTKQNEVSVLTMRVTEWRVIGGVKTKIGETIRDMQVIVISSPNNRYPTISNLVNKIVSCDSLGTFCVDIEADDLDNDDTLSFDFVTQLDSVTITNIGTSKRPKMRVCVTLDAAEVMSGKPLQILAKVSDDVCPFSATAEQLFTFTVGPHMPDSFSIAKNNLCRRLEFGFNNNSSTILDATADFVITTPDSSYDYSTTTAVPFVITDVKNPGWYKAKMTVSTPSHCDTRTYYDSVFISPANFMTLDVPKDTSVCFSSSFTVNSSVTNGTAPLKYNWNTGDSTSDITKSLQLGKNFYKVEVTDANGCYAKDSILIKYFNPTVVLSGDTAVCAKDKALLTATLANTTKPVFQWAGFAPGAATINPTINTTQQFLFTLVDSAGCLITKSHTVMASSPVIAFTHNHSQCIGDSIRLSVSATGGIGTYSYSWPSFSLSGNSLVLAPSTSAGKMYFTATATDALGCNDSKADSVMIQNLPTISITSPGTYCENTGAVSLASSATPTGGTWSGIGVSGTTYNTGTSGAGTFPLSYTYTDPTTGCSAVKNTQITVDKMPVADFFPSTTIGNKPLPVIFFNTTPDTTAQWKWIVKDSTGATINTSTQRHFNYTFTAEGKYSVVLIATNGLCADTIEKTDVIVVTTNVGIRSIATDAIKIYPNPIDKNGTLMIEGENILRIEITDVLGRKIENLSVLISDNKATVNMQGIDAGVYQIQIFDNASNSHTYKIVVNK